MPGTESSEVVASFGGERPSALSIRAFADADLEAVLAVFRAAVHGLTGEHYDAEQRAAWAPADLDRDAWRVRLASQRTLLAEVGGELAGFVTVAASGHVDLLFTAPAHARRGVATRLFRQAEAELRTAGVTELFTEASHVSRPFFERHGFVVDEVETVDVRGVALERFRMRRRPAADDPDDFVPGTESSARPPRSGSG